MRPTPNRLAVYPPREDSFLLLPFAEVEPGTTVAEVGAGQGLVALTAARSGARVVASDRNPEALRQLRAEARSKGLEVAVVRTDLLKGLGRFDRILANPPYLPTRAEEQDPDPWVNLALDGGPDGCRVMARLVKDLANHLSAHGHAFVVTSSAQDARARAAILATWDKEGGGHAVAASRSLEGERLDVLELWVKGTEQRPRVRRAVQRTRAPRSGIGDRPRTLRVNQRASNPVPGPGRTSVRGAA
jgi:release factor glutamine methyltransferase